MYLYNVLLNITIQFGNPVENLIYIFLKRENPQVKVKLLKNIMYLYNVYIQYKQFLQLYIVYLKL